MHVMKLSRLDVQEGNKLCGAEDYGAVANVIHFTVATVWELT